jgi:hypothetical protein
MDTTPVPQLPAEPAPEATQPLPPAEKPAEDVEDIFGTPPQPTETPAETTPPAEAPEDDIFGTSATGAAPRPAGGSGTTPSQPTTPATEMDDIFGPVDTNSPGGSTPPPGGQPTPPAGGEESTESGDDIFGTSHDVLREPGGLASAELRMWIDNTGNYSCRGRLVRFLDQHVRLLKDNGRTTTVPLHRLSAGDLQFVHRQASAHRAELAGQLAQSLTPLPLWAY